MAVNLTRKSALSVEIKTLTIRKANMIIFTGLPIILKKKIIMNENKTGLFAYFKIQVAIISKPQFQHV